MVSTELQQVGLHLLPLHRQLPGPGHLLLVQPNKVILLDHGAGRRWQEGGWLVLLGEVSCCELKFLVLLGSVVS